MLCIRLSVPRKGTITPIPGMKAPTVGRGRVVFE